MNPNEHSEELELLDLEIELGELRPTPIDPDLLQRISESTVSSAGSSDERSAVRKSQSVIRGFFARHGQVAAAAVLVLSSALLFLSNRPEQDSAPTHVSAPNDRSSSPDSSLSTTVVSGSDFQRVDNSSTITTPDDRGVIIEDGRPYRVLEYEVHEKQSWKDSKNGTRIKVERPQKQQMFIPMNVY